MAEPGLLWHVWHPWPEGVPLKRTTGSQRRLHGLLSFQCLSYPLSGGVHLSPQKLHFHFRTFKLFVILASKRRTSGRPREGGKSAPAPGQLLALPEQPLAALAAPGASAGSECRHQGSLAGSKTVKTANDRKSNSSYLCSSIFGSGHHAWWLSPWEGEL